MKKLICTAVVVAMGLPAIAQAEAQLYGKIRAFVGGYDTGATSEWKASSESSRLGFKGSSELEHDLEVIYQLEYQIDPTEGSGIGVEKDSADDDEVVKARNQYIGLRGGFGSVIVGQHDTPLKDAQGKVDLYSSYEEADIKKVFSGENRERNIVYYISPEMGGLEVHVAAMPGRNNDLDGDGRPDNDLADATSVALTYSRGPLYLAVANDNNVPGNGPDSRITSFFGQYRWDAVRLGWGYQTEDLNGAEYDGYLTSLGVQLSEPLELKLQHIARTADQAGDPENSQTTVGVDYALGDDTTLTAYASNRDEEIGGQAELDAYVIGLLHNF